MSDLPYSHLISVADIPSHGLDLKFAPGPEICAALARHLNVPQVDDLEARLHVAPERADGAHVTGEVRGRVNQISVVSLESFETAVVEPVDVRFASAETIARMIANAPEDSDIDPPDLVVDGVIDLGLLITEFLALGLDPYPRKPGEVFEPYEESVDSDAPVSPFAALARLKDPT